MKSEQKIRILQMLLQVVSAPHPGQPTAGQEEQSACLDLVLEIVGKVLHDRPEPNIVTDAALNQLAPEMLPDAAIKQALPDTVIDAAANQAAPCQGCQKNRALVARPLLTTDSVTYTIDSLGRLTVISSSFRSAGSNVGQGA